MYLAWAIVRGDRTGSQHCLAAATTAGVLLATHVVVVREERFLEGRFGAVYRSYKTSVRRYL